MHEQTNSPTGQWPNEPQRLRRGEKINPDKACVHDRIDSRVNVEAYFCANATFGLATQSSFGVLIGHSKFPCQS